MAAHQLAGRVDEDKGRPRAGPERLPDHEIGVIEDRMVQPIALDRVANARIVVLRGVLARMDADYDQRVSELGLEVLKVGDDVLAVDAAKRPEVEQDGLALEFIQRQWAFHVEPREAAGNGRCGVCPCPRLLWSACSASVHAASHAGAIAAST